MGAFMVDPTEPQAVDPTGPTAQQVGVGVIGFGWMGEVHSRAYARIRHHYPDVPLHPVPVAVSDPEADRTADAVRRFGFATTYADWRALLADDRVGLVSVTAPNFLHREIGVAVAEAGKHLWIEKPVGLVTSDAVAVADAVRAAGVQASVGFNYRNAPAVARARRLLQEGAIGTITHGRFVLFSDYAAHPLGALSWRFERARGGSGVLGDLVSHGIDLVHHLLGDVEALVADTATFIAQRPRPTGVQSHFARADGGDLGPVENEDYLAALLRCRDGGRVVLEASRVSVAEQNSYGFTLHGTRGALAWDFRRMGELQVSLGEAYQDQSVETQYVGRGDGDFAAFQPGAAIAMGYDDLKVIELERLVRSIVDAVPHGATVDDAVFSARALDAMTESAATGAWVSLA
jgi:predicted dehydrogenase